MMHGEAWSVTKLGENTGAVVLVLGSELRSAGTNEIIMIY